MKFIEHIKSHYDSFFLNYIKIPLLMKLIGKTPVIANTDIVLGNFYIEKKAIYINNRFIADIDINDCPSEKSNIIKMKRSV